MSRFNSDSLKSSKKAPKIPAHNVINRAGGVAYKADAKFAFASILLTSFVQDQAYRSKEQTVNEVTQAIMSGAVDPLFAAKAAIFARNEFGMRSTSHIVAGDIAGCVKGEPWTKNFLNAVVRRPDDMKEIMSYYMERYGKTVPNCMKKGFAKAFGKFDAYQLAKYKGGDGIKLVDIANLVHPEATEAVSALMKGGLVNESLEASKSAIDGKKGANYKLDMYNRLIEGKKLGYMALLKNLKDVVATGQEATVKNNLIDTACKMLVNEDAIRGSLVLPFRYVTAYQMLQESGAPSKVLAAVSDALDIACINVPKFEGETLVVLDASGSMTHGGSGQGKTPADIGAMFAAVVAKANCADLMLFEGDAKMHSVNPRSAVMDSVAQIKTKIRGGSTNLNAAMELMRQRKKAYDRVIIFSDMQAWVDQQAWGGWGRSSNPQTIFAWYKKEQKVNPYIYSFDLAGYGSMQFKDDKKVVLLAGFSEKVFDIMKMCEEDVNALVNRIEQVQF